MATLVGVLPATQLAYTQLDAYARSMGVSIGVADFGGIRTQADTAQILSYRSTDYNKALSSGLSPDVSIDRFRPVAPFGQSFHNYGAAFDVAVIARPASMSTADVLARLGAYAPSIGLRWGGTFSNPDTPHFELAVPITEAQTAYQAMTGSQVAGGQSDALGGFLDDVGGLGGDLSAAAPTVGLVAAALAVLGVMWWAIRRR